MIKYILVCLLLLNTSFAAAWQKVEQAYKGSLKVDVYTPDNMTTTTMVLGVFHGGGFIGGDKQNQEKFCKYFAQRGLVTCSFNYTLSNPTRAITDVIDAYDWLTVQPFTRYEGLEPQIGLVGFSAGGGLVAAAVYSHTISQFYPGYDTVYPALGMVLFYAPTQFETLPDVVTRFGSYDTALSLSPIHQIKFKPGVPCLLYHGQNDSVVPWQQSENFYRTSNNVNIPYSLYIPYSKLKLELKSGWAHGFATPNQSSAWTYPMTDTNTKFMWSIVNLDGQWFRDVFNITQGEPNVP